MDSHGFFLVIMLGYGLVSLINSFSDPLSDTKKLMKKFKSVGSMSGMHKDSIIKVVGPPQSMSRIGDNTLLQWILPGYHISIFFDQTGNFVKISSETCTIN